MARKKTAADELYNARRRARRLLARIERDGFKELSSSERSARATYIKSLKEHIGASYARKGESGADAAARLVGRLDALTDTVRAAKSKRDRSNVIFARQLNLASSGEPSSLGEHGRQKASVFYAATRHLWRGRDPNKRNEYILEGTGAKSLVDAYDMVMERNADALRIAIDGVSDSYIVNGITSENAFFYNEVEMDSELMGSTLWAAKLNLFR